MQVSDNQRRRGGMSAAAVRAAAVCAAIVIMAAAGLPAGAQQTEKIRRIEALVAAFGSPVGVAWSAGDTTYTVGNDGCYPLMSVFKTHCAVAALRLMQRQGTPVDTAVTVRAGQMMKNTYSPMLSAYPHDRDFRIPFDSLLHYSIAESDNNACDIIISLAGGIGAVSREMQAIGLADCRLTETEASMMADPMRSYNNCSTPESVVSLFRKIFDGGVVSGPYARCLKASLLATVTGAGKISAALPRGARLAHKTGTGFMMADGTKTADNDAGVILMPDGSKTYITILIRDSKAGDEACAQLMRSITKVVTAPM